MGPARNHSRWLLLLTLVSGVLLGCVLSFAGGVLAEHAPAPPAPDEARDASAAALPWQDARLLAEVLQRVRENYVDPVDDHQLMRQAAHGLVAALDDFGTVLSSLAYLRSLPISMLKIDGSFVRDVLRDPKAESTIQAIAQLARAMSLITVAEYVETDEIRHRIAQLGVDYGQGFAIGQPLPINDVLEQLPLYAAVVEGTVENIVLGDGADLGEAPPTAQAV